MIIKPYIWILSGNKKEADIFIRNLNLSCSLVRYVAHHSDLMGMRNDFILRIGAWYENKEYTDMDFVVRNGFHTEITLKEFLLEHLKNYERKKEK